MVFGVVVFGVSNQFEIERKSLCQQETSTIIRYLDAEVLRASEKRNRKSVTLILKDKLATQIAASQTVFQNGSYGSNLCS